jgi:DNA-binding NarL/FixJ family response regulator
MLTSNDLIIFGNHIIRPIDYNNILVDYGLPTIKEALIMPLVTKKITHAIYFRDVHEKSHECTTKLSSELGLTWDLASTWEDLTKALSSGERCVITHVSMLENSKSTVSDFVKAIESMIKFMPITSPLIIGVVIKKDTDLSIINQLRNTSVTGLLLDINDYDYQEVRISVDHLLERKPYWPNHIIDQLSTNSSKGKPLHVYFRKNARQYVNHELISKLNESDTQWQCELCNDWSELGESIKKDPYQLGVHIDTLTDNSVSIADSISMLQTFVKGMVPNKNVPIAVSINKTTTLATIKELQECGVFGIIPVSNEFGFEEAYKAVDALFNRIPYWPKHIIDQLPNDKKPKGISNAGITLTPRQQQIFKLVSTRGASNKVIAKTLKITESTVKAHVSAILKAYGVRNRTQLVVSANNHP